MRVIASPHYERRSTKLLSPEERAIAEAGIIARPEAWPIISATGGARKARIAVGGRGKRGGGRLIYFFSATPAAIALLDVYAKNEKEDLTHADKIAIRAAIQQIRKALGTNRPR
jgi:hypothetical protein